VNVYAESNFVLELALLQEERESCEQILALADEGGIRLILPAYCLVEPFETLSRRRIHRDRLGTELDQELRQLSRSRTYAARAEELRELVALLTDSTEEEVGRLERWSRRLLEAADFVALSAPVLSAARDYRSRYDLPPQDSVVYASVVQDLATSKPERACFITRNPRDFEAPELLTELHNHRCKLISRFGDAVQYLESQRG